ncbi:tetratricopeptide repeat protein [Microbacterium sp. CIAB417]|uniref:tetratricopeptide repeat protein n=1 Tax=Microbacterium sp. CIAB417 TaxID=2860287 RepID=UPI001FAD7A6A|nr:tetratricopeptide repeat protein [Microbacterium sp. CIAB417]
MTTRIGVALMGVCLILYFVVAGQQAFLYISTGDPIAVAMGIALIVLPLIGVWALVREIQFGVAADRLGRRLDAEGGMPEAETELTPSGRIAPEDAEGIVSRYRSAAQEAPEDWRAQYRLGVVQDAAGRRKDARASIREAIRVEKQTR